MTWRDKAAPIVARVLRETLGQSESDIKHALWAAYPWGERKYHPYRIWLSEIRRQRFAAGGRRLPRCVLRLPDPPDPRQLPLL